MPVILKKNEKKIKTVEFKFKSKIENPHFAIMISVLFSKQLHKTAVLCNYLNLLNNDYVPFVNC